MYTGPVDTVADYFGARGHPCPGNYNPADWIMVRPCLLSFSSLPEDSLLSILIFCLPFGFW